MISEKEFEIMRFIKENNNDDISQRKLSGFLNTSLGNINKTVVALKTSGLITDEYKLTKKGKDVLKQYKVDNAIILAAGMSTRFMPFSTEKPKGLTVVKGEVIIERLINQLREAGIKEIVIVLGHMMEKFLYLKDKYNLTIVINDDYRFKNTHSSIFYARKYLKNTYICCADNYYPESVFHGYEFHSLYSTVFMNGIWRGERGVTTNKKGLIISTQRPAVDQWVMNGYAYFNKVFSKKFKRIIEETFNKPETDQLYWEQVYAEHVNELELYEKRYTSKEIMDFDTTEELEKFDPNYIINNNSAMTKNICSVLNCNLNDIHHIMPLEKGYTNYSFLFECKDNLYIYRLPNNSSSEWIDRKAEKRIREHVSKIGVDDSYIYEDEKTGWMISKYIKTVETFDFSKQKHLKMLCKALHKLFDNSFSCGKRFDYWCEANNLLEKIRMIDLESYEIAQNNKEGIKRVYRELVEDNWPSQLVHNDLYEDNLLVYENGVYLIDWEYAGDSDIGYDLCKLFVKNDCTGEDIDKYLKLYFGRQPTFKERNHIIGCAVVSFYFWYIWALLMVKRGKSYAKLVSNYYEIFSKYLREYTFRK